MNLSNFTAYVKQLWKNKPDTSTPLSAERLTHQEEGIKGNSDAIQELAAAVVSQIVNDPDKIASMAALYAVNQKIGDTSQLPEGTTDTVGAITKCYSDMFSMYDYVNKGNIDTLNRGIYWVNGYETRITGTLPFTNVHYILMAACNIKGDAGIQCAIPQGTGSSKIRYQQNGKWQGWT